jgi:hypothetical protein
VENGGDEGSPEVVRMLAEWGYGCWWHLAPYYNPENFFYNGENVWANLKPSANMICVPRESQVKVAGFEAVRVEGDSWRRAVARMGAMKG